MNNCVKSSVKYGASIALGAVSGFFGGGGGMLAVPLLQYVGLDEKRAHASALFVILPVCIVCAAVYFANGYCDTRIILSACIGVVPGGIIGAAVLDKLNPVAVGIVFSVLMIAVGIKTVV